MVWRRDLGIPVLFTTYPAEFSHEDLIENRDRATAMMQAVSGPFLGLIDASRIQRLPVDTVSMLRSVVMNPGFVSLEAHPLVVVASAEGPLLVARMLLQRGTIAGLYGSLAEAEVHIRQDALRLIEARQPRRMVTGSLSPSAQTL